MTTITTTDEARDYLVESILPKLGDTTFQTYVKYALAGDFAYHLARYLAALPLPAMPLQELTDEDITKLALDAGFQKHPLNGELVTMHRNGSWVDITSRLSNFADLVIAENYVPVMPEQAEPVAYINEDTLEWMKEIGAKLHTKMQLAFSTYPFQKNTLPLFSQDPSALLARVAELETENEHLRTALKAHGDIEISEEDEEE